MSDDQRALIDIEKNIANIERSMSANQLAKTNRQQVILPYRLFKNYLFRLLCSVCLMLYWFKASSE